MATKHLKETSYCGLYCADCPFQGTIPDLARDLRKELRKYKFEKAAEVIPFPEFKKYDDCYEVLGAMVKLRCGGCRGGFRSKYCNIAKCATEKGFEGCWECSKVEGCKEFEFLEATHGDANTKNLKNIAKTGVDEWADGSRLWYSAPAKSSKPPASKK
jgi:hypothetical protein